MSIRIVVVVVVVAVDVIAVEGVLAVVVDARMVRIVGGNIVPPTGL